MIRVAYFGLPLAALLLARDGIAPAFVALSRMGAPGRRRARRQFAGKLLDPRDFDDPDDFAERALEKVRGARPDLVVSWYWTRRLPADLLAVPPLGAVGVHPSLLPRHRGPNPFYAAIDAGDAVTGVTVHRLTAEYDEGDVIEQESLDVGGRDAWQLARALDRPSLRALRRVVGRLARGETVTQTAQDGSLATWGGEPEGDALRVDFRWSTERVLRRVRAVSPVPGVALEIRGAPFFVTEAASAVDFPASLAPGEAALVSGRVVVRTGDGAVVLSRAVVEDPDAEEPRVLRGEAIAGFVGLSARSSTARALP